MHSANAPPRGRHCARSDRPESRSLRLGQGPQFQFVQSKKDYLPHLREKGLRKPALARCEVEAIIKYRG